MTSNQIKLMILQELNSLLEGCEKYVAADDDPSGYYGEWVLDTEKFRDKLQNKILELELEVKNDPS